MTYIIYIFSLISSVSFAYLSNKKLKIIDGMNVPKYLVIFLSLMVIALLVGLRGGNVGVDTYSYITFFNGLDNFNFRDLFANLLEPGFVFVSFLIKKANLSVTIYLLIFAILTLLLFFQFYKNKLELLPWAIFFAFSTGYVFFMMNGLRQALAVPLVALSLKYVTDRKLIKFLLLILFASLFHYSALLMLPIYFVNYVSKIKYQVWIILFVLSIFISPFAYIEHLAGVLSLLPKDYVHYFLKLNLKASKFSMGFLFHLGISFLVLYFASQLPLNKYYKNILSLYFVGVVLMNLTWQSAVLLRFSVYFTFFQIPMLSYIMYELEKKNKLLPIVLIAFLFFVSFSYKIMASDSGCSPYYLSF